MKLSQMHGPAVMDAIGAIIGPAARLVADERVRRLFSQPGETTEERGGNVLAALGEVLPGLWADYRDDLTAILAALDGTTPEAYLKDVTLKKLFDDVKDVLTDEGLLSFLPSAGSQEE